MKSLTTFFTFWIFASKTVPSSVPFCNFVKFQDQSFHIQKGSQINLPYRTKQNRTKFQSEKIISRIKFQSLQKILVTFVQLIILSIFKFQNMITLQLYRIQTVFFQGKNSKNTSQFGNQYFILFNHNVIFLINYKSVIFLCFIYQKQFCLPFGIHNLTIAFKFWRFVNQGLFFLPFGIHNLTIGLTLCGKFTYQRCFKGAFLFVLVSNTTSLSLWLSSDNSLMSRFICTSEDDSSLSFFISIVINEQSVDINSFILVLVKQRGHLKFIVNGIFNPPAGIGDGPSSVDFTVPSI